MGKIRVYELATKLGLENTEMVEKLNQAGVEVKNHMSTVDEEMALKFGGALNKEPAVEAEVEVQEERLNVGLIRRRRAVAKEEPPAAVVEEPPAAAAAPAEPEPQKAAPAQPVEVAQDKPADTVVEKTVVAEEAPARTAEAEESPAEAKPAVVEPEKKKERKEVVTRAKILGRVDLPRPAAPQRRQETAPSGRPGSDRPTTGRPGSDRPTTGRPGSDRPTTGRPGSDRPTTGRPGSDRPTTGRPGSDRPTTGRPGSDRPTTGRAPAGRPGAPGASLPPVMTDIPTEKDGRAYNNKKKKKGRDSGGMEADGPRRAARREVYEPDRNERFRKGKKSNRPTKKTEITQSKAIKRKIRISDVITIGELAKRMGAKANDLIKELMRQGQMVTINHPLDYESAMILAAEFGYEVENVAFDEESVLSLASLSDKEEPEENLVTRPPVVTIMGHVDHGKTSLLDAIRQANVTEGEAGGITQHIGAYDVDLDGRKITFLDTPGHEAFTSMRARGAQVTDLVILVVAADDGVMPQTKEAINHSKAAGVPIIVAVNKIDKPGANADRIKQELSELGLLPEDWGGETIYVSVSAKEKTNIDQLLEMVLLQAEVLDLKANPNKRAQGSVVEARLDKGRGPVATVLVQQGTLKIGDPIVAGIHYGRVRSMSNDRGQIVKEAGPSFPVEVTGLTGVPEAGEPFNALEDEKSAKDVAQHRAQKARELELAKHSKISLEQLYARIQEGDVKELKVIVKADVQGSAEAVSDTLSKLSTAACRLIVIHSGVGAVTETDISLASASDAIVLAFNVRPAPKAAVLAELEGVDIRPYNVIYDAVNDVKSAMEGLLAPTLKEEELGRAEVREAFNVTKVGTVAGCYVTSGKIQRNAHARLLRDNVVIWTGKLSSLRRFKDDVREVGSNYECGIGLERYNDVKPGDVIEVYEIKEVKTIL